MLALALATLALTAQPLYSETRPTMGTVVSVQIAGAKPELAQRAAGEAFAVFAHVEQVMNEWRPESPLSALNRNAGSAEAVVLPGDLCGVLERALEGAKKTGGLFDPTWAALRGLWRFGPNDPPVPPSDEALAAACPLVGWKGLELQPADDGCFARLKQKGMQVGLGGLAKGYAVDRAVEVLRQHGLKDFVVQAGGDLFAAGKRFGKPWQVGIRDPRGAANESVATVEVSDRAFSTSGDYEHFFVADGKRYHHLIDPRTCRPATASQSASIFAKTATDAEILGKATFILGGEGAMELAERSGAGVVLVAADGRRRVSRSLFGRVRWTKKGADARR